MSRISKNLFFVIILLAICLYYDYHHIIFKPTQGIHQWRQTDGASFARNYYLEGMNFFQPKTHNLTSDGGTTSFTATADTPFLYYSVAILYKIFGYHEFLFRLLNTLIYLLGLLYLFRAMMLIFKDFFYASGITLLAFSSPVLIYYASNFIPDSASLAFMFIAIFHFFKYRESSKNRYLILMFFFFFISGSLKITSLIMLFAIAVIFLLEWLGWVKSGPEKIFKKPIAFISGSFISVGLVLSWVIYARWYNKIHESSYFSTTIFPIWRTDREGITKVLDGIRNNWLTEYYHYSVYLLLGICFILFILYIKKIRSDLRIIIPVLILLSMLYFFLQFTLLRNHDYYLISLYILPVILIAGVLHSLRQIYPKILNSLFFKAGFILFILFNIYYAESRLEKRYHTDIEKNDFYTITPTLRNLGLTRDTRVISIPGGSHINLYLMDQKGWTEFVDHKLHRGKFYAYNRDREGILKSIENGAEYLILSNIDQLFEKPFLNEFATHLAGTWKNVLIFDLKNNEQNFNLDTLITEYDIFCNAEILDESGLKFLSTDSVFRFESGQLQSDEKAFSADHSIKLDQNHPFGMSIKFPDLKQAESFKISVRRLGQDNSGSIQVAGENLEDFYLFENNSLLP